MNRRSTAAHAEPLCDGNIQRLVREVENAAHHAMIASATCDIGKRSAAVSCVLSSFVRAHELLVLVNLEPDHHELVRSVLEPLAHWLERERAATSVGKLQ